MDITATFTVNGRAYQIADTDRLTFGEQRALKRLSGIATADFDDALIAMDADAWFALLLVSMRRDRPDATEAELEAVDFIEVMMPLADQWNQKASAVAGGGDADPPPMAVGASEAPPSTETTIHEGAGVL